MRKNLKPKSYLYPLPVLVIATYDSNGTPNAMNAAWGTIADTKQVAIFISHEHKTYKNIMLKKAFTVSIANESNTIDADYIGIVSGNDKQDKLKNTKWTITKSEFIDAPIINELPLTLECKFLSFDEKTELLLGEVVNVSVDEKILTDDKIDILKLKPVAYDMINHKYRNIGDIVGNAFKDGLKLKK